MKNKNSIQKIIHTINNSLTSSGLCAQMLLSGMTGELSNEQKKYLKTILSNGKEIQKLVAQIAKIVTD